MPRPRRVLPVRCVDRAVALAVCPALRAVLVALPVAALLRPKLA